MPFEAVNTLRTAQQIYDFPFKTWRTGHQISDFQDTLGLNGLHTALAPNSLRPAEGCLFMDIQYVTSLLSHPRLNAWGFVRLQAVCGQSVWYSDSFITFRKESVIIERRNVLGMIWFFQNYCRTMYPMFLRTFFSENDDFVTYLLTYLWSWDLLEKPPIVQPLKNFPAFYGTRKFNTMFTRACPYPEPYQFNPHHPMLSL
jgi:hypothetical protein